MKKLLCVCVLFVCVVVRAETPRTAWEALAMIESGGRDKAVGKAGEVSRYQILPSEWRRFALPGEKPTNQQDALRVTCRIFQARQAELGKPRSWFDLYVMWNAPGQLGRPSRAVRERATRFSNLCVAYVRT